MATDPKTTATTPSPSTLDRAQKREAYAFQIMTGLVYRKDGSGTGTGLARLAIKYTDALLAELDNPSQG